MSDLTMLDSEYKIREKELSKSCIIYEVAFEHFVEVSGRTGAFQKGRVDLFVVEPPINICQETR